MPKRKCKEENSIGKKLRKIENMLKQRKTRRRIISSSDSEDSSQSLREPCDGETNLRSDTDLDSIIPSKEQEIPPQQLRSNQAVSEIPVEQPLCPAQAPMEPIPSTSQVAEEHITPFTENSEIENDIIDLLGEDPSATIIYGKDIRPELAGRFNHITTNGLNKDQRKELCEKYLIPGNCTLIGAPILNKEVKVALNETTVKRDKLIEARQKRVASAIACLGEAISHALGAKDKDNAQIKRLMDTARLICDSQYNDSVSRRNLAIWSLKKEMKEPLMNTKIDKSLFGENLSDSLKSAKAVTRSGSDLKNQYKAPPKNWRNPVVGRRPPTTGRRSLPAAPMMPAQTATPVVPAHPEPRSWRAQTSRKPPPPPPRFARRRY